MKDTRTANISSIADGGAAVQNVGGNIVELDGGVDGHDIVVGFVMAEEGSGQDTDQVKITLVSWGRLSYRLRNGLTG